MNLIALKEDFRPGYHKFITIIELHRPQALSNSIMMKTLLLVSDLHKWTLGPIVKEKASGRSKNSRNDSRYLLPYNFQASCVYVLP